MIIIFYANGLLLADIGITAYFVHPIYPIHRLKRILARAGRIAVELCIVINTHLAAAGIGQVPS